MPYTWFVLILVALLLWLYKGKESLQQIACDPNTYKRLRRDRETNWLRRFQSQPKTEASTHQPLNSTTESFEKFNTDGTDQNVEESATNIQHQVNKQPIEGSQITPLQHQDTILGEDGTEATRNFYYPQTSDQRIRNSVWFHIVDLVAIPGHYIAIFWNYLWKHFKSIICFLFEEARKLYGVTIDQLQKLYHSFLDLFDETKNTSEAKTETNTKEVTQETPPR